MSSRDGQVLFMLSKKDGTPTGEVVVSTDTENASDQQSDTVETDECEANIVLCLLWLSGKLGAAYYNINSKQLYILTDMLDPDPEFLITRNLLRSINFKHVVTMGSPCDKFIKLIIDFINNNLEYTLESDQIRQVPKNVTLLSLKEFSYQACELKILSLNLPGCTNEQESDVYLHSLVDFSNKLSVHALGALVKFTEMSWAYLNDQDNAPEAKFIHINQISMENNVYISNNTLEALQVFRKTSHDARFKRGCEGGSREGLSIFKLFFQNCRSKMGINCLRRMLQNPLKDINEINKRLNFIEFVQKTENSGFVAGLQDNIKKIFDVDSILSKIQYCRASSYDWDLLYKAIFHVLYIHELCRPYRASCALLDDLNSAVTANLYGIENCIRDSLEFTYKKFKFAPVVKPGIDEELDKKRMRREDIGKYLTVAANFTVNKLPNALDECTVIYVPEMGHLLALKMSETNTDPNQLEHLGFQFMVLLELLLRWGSNWFEVHDIFHYKNAMCKELDKHLGQIQDDIIAHEVRIIERISGLIMRYIKDIREPLQIVASVDCLISMAQVAKERNYVRPTLNNDNITEITDGRHILFELQCDNFVPNDYKSGGEHSRVKIITGPNNCGKSVFLKQITQIVYLAHVGSFVPASSANISMVHSIHTTIRNNESATLPLSAFTIDLSQMAQALNNAKPTSLVIVDEFGKGTTGLDGLALLAAALKHFMKNAQTCPHLLVATHFQQIEELLPRAPLLSYLTFDFTKNDQDVIFLYKMVEGVSTSFAFDVALAAGLDQSLVDRAREIHKAIQEGSDIKPLNYVEQNYDLESLLNIDIPDLD